MLEGDAGCVEFVAAKDVWDITDFAAAADFLPPAAIATSLSS